MLSAHEIRQVSVEADGTDPRTIVKFLRGGPVQPVCAARIRAALARLGRADLAPGSAGMNATELAPTGGMRL